jgi:hypothetical protein
LGAPLPPIGYPSHYSSEYFKGYDGISFYLNDGVSVNLIQVQPDKCEINGVTLDKNRSGIISALGSPVFEDWKENVLAGKFEYVMEYISWDAPAPVLIGIKFSDPNDKADLVNLYPYSA